MMELFALKSHLEAVPCAHLPLLRGKARLESIHRGNQSVDFLGASIQNRCRRIGSKFPFVGVDLLQDKIEYLQLVNQGSDFFWRIFDRLPKATWVFDAIGQLNRNPGDRNNTRDPRELIHRYDM
jgi:hypothetical protein